MTSGGSPIPTPRPTPASAVADDRGVDTSLPAELEARIAAAAGEDGDFDAVSWAWMATLGLLIPLALVAVGWWLGETP